MYQILGVHPFSCDENIERLQQKNLPKNIGDGNMLKRAPCFHSPEKEYVKVALFKCPPYSYSPEKNKALRDFEGS